MKSLLTSLPVGSFVDSQPLDPALEQLIEAAASQIQAGEPLDVEQLIAAHPKYAQQLRQLLPAVEMLVRMGEAPPELAVRSAPANGRSQTPPPQQLGSFQIIRELGRGGMGTVFEAEQLSMGRRVALKVLPFATLADEKSLQRFRNEVRAAAALDHPNIVSIYSVGEERGVHFYAMQLIRGQTLADVISESRTVRQRDELAKANTDDVLTIDSSVTHPRSTKAEVQARISTVAESRRSSDRYRSAARLGIQAAEALQHAHDQGVLHRDIKPGNLMLDAEGQLYITDFGLARIEADAGMTMTGDVIGTLRYMAPEQALAKRGIVDHRADIYSLGATLYELLALEPAFGETDRADLLRQIACDEPLPLRKVDRRIPAELETIVGKAMAKLPDERYQSAQSLADDLRAFLEHRPIQAKPPTLANRLAKWSRRHQTLVRAAAIVFVLLTAFLAVGMVVVKRSEIKTASALEKVSDLLYTADMTVAFQNFGKGWFDEAQPMLDRYHRQDGEADRRGWEYRLLQSLVRPPAAYEFVGHEGSVNEIAVFPDRQRLASVGDDGTLRIWDLQSQSLLKSLKLGLQPLYSLAVSPDGRYIAAGSNTVFLCDLVAGDRVQEIFHGEHHIESLAFRPDGACVAAGSRYHNVFLISREGELLGRARVRRESNRWSSWLKNIYYCCPIENPYPLQITSELPSFGVMI